MNLNKAHLIGRITRDPEIKALPSGKQVAKFGLATNHIYKNKAGEKVETAQFHNCVAFGRIAEILEQYVKKGQEIYVEGRIEYRSWDKKEGGKGYATEIMVENIQMGARAKDTGKVESERSEGPGEETSPTDAKKSLIGEDEIDIEDIPF